MIGCDGIRSSIAKWMGFPEPKYVGHCAFRGLASYSDGQPYGPRVNYIYGRGVRAGYVPVSPTKVYWFICFNSPSPGPKQKLHRWLHLIANTEFAIAALKLFWPAMSCSVFV